MITATLILFAFIIFPLFINVNIYFDKNLSKLFFSFSFLSIIRIGGYVEKISEGIAIHYSNKRAIIIDYKNLFKIKNKIKPLNDYHFIKFKSTIEIGGKNDVLNFVYLGFLINYIENVFEWFIYNKKPYVKLNNNVNVYTNEEVFKIYINVQILFNLLMVIISVIKILVGKSIYAIRNKKQQN